MHGHVGRINREAGSSPAQPPLPYLGMSATTTDAICQPLEPDALGRRRPQLIHKSEDLPYSLKYYLSEGEGMF